MGHTLKQLSFLMVHIINHICIVTGKGKVVQMQIIVKCRFFSSVIFKSCKSTAHPCHVTWAGYVTRCNAASHPRDHVTDHQQQHPLGSSGLVICVVWSQGSANRRSCIITEKAPTACRHILSHYGDLRLWVVSNIQSTVFWIQPFLIQYMMEW